MVERQVTFFPIPLGRHLHPDNLHGLATGSGGTVVRIQLFEDALPLAMKRLNDALAAPVLYPTQFSCRKKLPSSTRPSCRRCAATSPPC